MVRLEAACCQQALAKGTHSMRIELLKTSLAGPLALLWCLGQSLLAAPANQKAAPANPKASPTAQQILAAYQPLQKDAQIDTPEGGDLAKCTIAVSKSGYVVRDGSGQMLRNFKDTNGDGVVDQWCYFKEGVEVYRDIDSNFNSKPDQYRWLNTAGMRWAIDA